MTIGCVSASDLNDTDSSYTNDNIVNSDTATVSDSDISNDNQISSSEDSVLSNESPKYSVNDSANTTDSDDSTVKSSTKNISNDELSSSSKSSTTVTVTSVKGKPGATVTLKATIKTTAGQSVTTGTVAFKVNGKTIKTATVKNSVATISYTIPTSFKNPHYNITAVYGENSKYYSSRVNGTLSVIPMATKVSVTAVTGKAGSRVTLKSVITTTDGSYVSSGTVAFKINGKTVGTAKVSGGGAKLNYTIPSSYKNPHYTITVVYGSNSDYKTSSGTGKLTVIPMPTVVTVTNTTAYSGNSITFKATIKTSDGYTATGGKVAFKINGITIGKTNLSKGVATLTYKIPSNWKTSYKITAVYSGSTSYKASQGSGVLKVISRSSTKITVTNITSTAGSSVTLKATIKTTSGSNVASGTVAFKINGITVGKSSVSKGVTTLSYKIPSNWKSTYTITVVYGTSTYYKSSTGTGKLVINSKNSVPSGYEKYVKSTSNCPVNNSAIKKITNSVISGISGTYNQAKALFNYVRDEITYSSYYNTRYGAVGTLSRGYGNCVDQSHLLIAMLRTANIPARYVHGLPTYFNSGLVVGHVWVEAYVNGQWYKCDTTSSRNSFGVINSWYKTTIKNRYISLPF